MGDSGLKIPVQIFATDISESAIQKARSGVYPASIERHVSKERLKRFFSKVDGGYKISKGIRELCLFSKHDVTSDPPFAKLDLVSCRNMLIYFSASLQKRVLPIFHYALKYDGFLWLGKSESTGGTSEFFSPVDKAHKIYSKVNIPTPMTFRSPISPYVPEVQESTPRAHQPGTGGGDVQRDSDRIALSKYAPPSVTVNSDFEILQYRGRTTPYLEQTSGPPSSNLLKLARQELLHSLRVTFQTAVKQNSQARQEGLSYQADGERRQVNIEVIPANPFAPASQRNYVIFFEEATVTSAPDRLKNLKVGAKKAKKKGAGKEQTQLIDQMELDASAHQHYHKSLIAEYEAAREELTAGNEELQSTNEELQSTNEELETAKEEVQSSNEELTTVNEELQNRNSDLTALTSDLNNIITSVEIPLVIVGGDHRIRRFTPGAEKTFKLIATDIGRPLGDIKTSFDLDLETLVSEVTNSLTTLEREIQDRDGRWMRLQIRPFRTIDNRIDGAVISLMDIDVLKQSLKSVNEARAEAERANRAKDLFLATLSHELRTPLTAVISWSQMIKSGRLDADKILKAAETIEACGKIQAALINDLLDVSRIVTGKLSLDMIEVNPAAIIAKAIDFVRPEAEKKSIHIEATLGSWAGMVMADPLRLQQVFVNLLTNAIKFSSPDSKVWVMIDKVRDHEGEKAKAVVKVVDSGKGISSEFLPHIFDSFSQEDASSVRVHGGLGIGLAIVQNLVELHGGKVIAESPGEKLGATFTVILPVKSEHQSVGAKKVEADVLSRPLASTDIQDSLKGIRVLIVDDDPSAKDAITETLRSFGAETQSAESAKDGLNIVTHFRPHVLVSDIAMPEEDGYSFIRKIRALDPNNGGKIPALALTAYAGQDDIKRVMFSGFQAHLAKPVDGHRLAEVIAQLAGRT